MTTDRSSPPTTRFAPSPTGLLHLGHAHSAIEGWRRARDFGGRFLLRIEDIDRGRCRPEFEATILEDLAWLGLDWDGAVRRQSEHMDNYAAALARLDAMGVLYPCFCTRKSIEAEIAASSGAPHLAPQGPDGPLYPGICREFDPKLAAERIAAGAAFALRLDVVRAATLTGPLDWTDEIAGPQQARPEMLGDVVLARKEVPTSYHLAVTVDDHIQGVTVVTRGLDLFHATHVHRLIQALLGLDVPVWRHHGLLVDSRGQRLAKRTDALSLRALRDRGMTPGEVRQLAARPVVDRGLLPCP